MKTQSIIAAAVLSIAGSAFAQGEATYEYPQPVSSSKSRSEVRAEAIQARRGALPTASPARLCSMPSNCLGTGGEVRTSPGSMSRSGRPRRHSG